MCVCTDRVEVAVGEDASLDVDPEEAVGGEGDGLLPAEDVRHVAAAGLLPPPRRV